MNIAKRMVEGDLFWFSNTPRINRREVVALEALGFQIQEDHGFHEDHAAYSLHPDKFKERFTELGGKL